MNVLIFCLNIQFLCSNFPFLWVDFAKFNLSLLISCINHATNTYITYPLKTNSQFSCRISIYSANISKVELATNGLYKWGFKLFVNHAFLTGWMINIFWKFKKKCFVKSHRVQLGMKDSHFYLDTWIDWFFPSLFGHKKQ